ncbi:uncharacterized protein LOC114240503 [Bombyx mandarina]|uniref:Uncharacterized protein LOC114240503 n=1 Tax=Bombyx mandarina TaxID=7092 RepID=A0A6J2JBR7_BOMMA|nr:uncharacterized protein LOC114240503 [Bombyx mandarina]
MSFTNKVVLVTGGSSGIVASAAVHFAKEGAEVAIVGRNVTKLDNVARKCAQVGKKPLIIKADISKDEEAKTIVQQTIDAFGKLDVLINNAGMNKSGSLLAGNLLESYGAVTATNLRAVILITSLAAPHLIETKGNIINVSSIGGTMVPMPGFLAYCMGKASLNQFTRGIALELAPHGVRANIISPGPVLTDIRENSDNDNMSWDDFKAATALKKLGEPSEIADLMLFLASDKARSITGSNYVSDNGMLLLR